MVALLTLSKHQTPKRMDNDETKPELRRFLTAANYFLRRREFTDCRNYAARALNSDPNNPAPIQILTIATVLSAPNISSTRPDYYAVLNLPHFETNVSRIVSAFKALAPILNPKSNPYPLSSEAFDVVLKAWTVLSDPSEKAMFDDELMRSSAVDDGGGTFWTICPYCYYVYEYDGAYQDCSLRCANERCRRVLHAAAMVEPPPPEVVDKGCYWCPGFLPLGARSNCGDEMGEKFWAPFAGNACAEEAEKVGEMGFQDHDDGKRKQVESEDSNNLETGDANGEKPESRDGIGNDSGFIESGEKEVGKRRKKSVPWNSKKLMGRGFRIESDQVRFFVNGVSEEGRSNVDEVQVLVCDTNDNNVGSEMEFFEGDDDVFVGLNLDFDLQNGVL